MNRLFAALAALFICVSTPALAGMAEAVGQCTKHTKYINQFSNPQAAGIRYMRACEELNNRGFGHTYWKKDTCSCKVSRDLQRSAGRR